MLNGEKYTFKTATARRGKAQAGPGEEPQADRAVRTKGPHAGEKMLGIYELRTTH